MKLFPHATGRILYVSLAIGVFASGIAVPAGGQEAPPAVISVDVPQAIPSLADVVYQAGALSQRLAALKNRPDTGGTLQKLALRLKQAGSEAAGFSYRLGLLKDEDLQSYQALAALKGEVRSETDDVSRVSESLAEAIREVEFRRRNWLAEKYRWEGWRSQLGADLALKSVADAFTRSTTDIGEALEILSGQLEPMLAVQQQAGDIGAKFSGLTDQIDTMMAQQRGGTLRGGMPVMFSIAYLQQLIDLAIAPARLVELPSLPDPAFLRRNGWVVALQALVFVSLLAAIRRYRPKLMGDPIYGFLVKRPYSLTLFVTVFALFFLYESPPAIWLLLVQTVAGVATARLLAVFVDDAWTRRAIYVLVLVMICFQASLALGLPLAAMRLFILVWSVIGIVYLMWWSRKAVVAGKPAALTWLSRLVLVGLMVILVADVTGFGNFAVDAMDSVLRSSAFLIMGWAMIRLVRAALELGAASLPKGGLNVISRNVDSILRRVLHFATTAIVLYVAANLLVALKLYALPAEALQAFFGFGMTIGAQRITIGLVVTAALILYGAFVLSWTLQALLMEKVLTRRRMDEGARLSIVRLMHYALVLVGFLIALSALGFELKNVTIIGGALGVGIGFGMQAIVSNFVSGLILLFERPIKVGDVIQLSDGQQGRVLNLGLRATTVQTFDRAEIVVPNADLIANQVTNWTLGDRGMRLSIPVGAAYGSDVETVMRELLAAAMENDRVLKDPRPVVLFLNFGDSSLDFQLRVWIADFGDRRIIQSDLIRDIDRRFRAEGIEIPFPQRDLHLRSVDDNAAIGVKGDSSPTLVKGEA
jgi:small-conductance mechanosensitive channel